jgi:hypothetical protein
MDRCVSDTPREALLQSIRTIHRGLTQTITRNRPPCAVPIFLAGALTTGIPPPPPWNPVEFTSLKACFQRMTACGLGLDYFLPAILLVNLKAMRSAFIISFFLIVSWYNNMFLFFFTRPAIMFLKELLPGLTILILVMSLRWMPSAKTSL